MAPPAPAPAFRPEYTAFPENYAEKRLLFLRSYNFSRKETAADRLRRLLSARLRAARLLQERLRSRLRPAAALLRRRCGECRVQFLAGRCLISDRLGGASRLSLLFWSRMRLSAPAVAAALCRRCREGNLKFLACRRLIWVRLAATGRLTRRLWSRLRSAAVTMRRRCRGCRFHLLPRHPSGSSPTAGDGGRDSWEETAPLA
ncbi:hypothetical protein AXF42_Ash007840 [Apostasia shenzhenica]|uniref:Uncharacterized protein n=1 Tax=Apostasia shenzhenica TaxID=1088818 RepID=A0A2I0B5G9_9ASPA|nr:hypothetical protein AXF42_Ash007840 [Apostasia shenzhenica]